MRLINATLLALVIVNLGACAWVELTPQGEKVRVLDLSDVAKCQYLGTTTASVTEKVAGIRRHDAAINEELIIVARNAAVNLDGDTVVADGAEAEGKRKFRVYRCVPR